MRGTTTYYANLYSHNQPTLQFPYQGGSPLQLSFWRDKGSSDPYPFEPTLILRNGQFDCSSVDGCMLAMKLDDGPMFYRKASNLDCGENKCLTISLNGTLADAPDTPLMKRARTGKVLVIEVPIWRYGNYQYEFR